MSLTPGQLRIVIALGCAILIPLVLYRYVQFKPRFDQTEQAVAQFSPTAQKTSVQRSWHAAAVAINPLGAAAAPPANASQPKQVTQQQPKPHIVLPTVTFILQSADKKMAIVDGTIVHEGELFRTWKIARIERNRVLLEGRKGTRWIHLE